MNVKKYFTHLFKISLLLFSTLSVSGSELMVLAEAEPAKGIFRPPSSYQFEFAVPDDMVEFVGAYVILVGNGNGEASIETQLWRAKDEDPVNSNPFTPDSISAPIQRNTVHQIDITSQFPTDLADGAGEDFVSLKLGFNFTRRFRADVVGIIIQYNSTYEDLSGLMEYADNSQAIASGELMPGDLYRCGDFLKVVH